MYVYKENDIVSNYIINTKKWESKETNNIIKALSYYSEKKNLSKNDIYIIDIGANIGWYTFTLSKYGYKIFSFEPSKINYYILRKNYCINKELNIILINKGLYNEDKKCNLYNIKGNIGNGIIVCENKINNTNLLKNLVIREKIVLTKLSYYIPLLKNNLALIKIDVECLEGKVIEGGIELITKYHIPFIIMEFNASCLKSHGTEPKKFLQIFLNNGYKISPLKFLDERIYTIDYFNTKKTINLYVSHTKI